MVPASRIDSTTMTTEQDAEQLDDLQPLGLDRLVDVAALGRQQQRAAHRAEALHRHRDRDDDLAAIVDAHHVGALGAGRAPAPPRDSPCRRRGRARDRAAGRRGRARSGTRSSARLNTFGLLLVRRRQVEAQHLAGNVEIAAVEDEIAVAVVDAGARLGRRDQPAQHRRDALRIDREFEPGHALVAEVVARLQFEQPVGVDVGAVAVGGGRGGDGAGDDLALHHEALHPRVDQAGAELRQIEDADDQRDQARDVERDDAAGEAGEALADEELPGAPRDAAQSALGIDLRDAARQIGERVAAGRAAGSSGRWRLGGSRRGFGGSIEQWGRCRLVCPSRAL